MTSLEYSYKTTIINSTNNTPMKKYIRGGVRKGEYYVTPLMSFRYLDLES